MGLRPPTTLETGGGELVERRTLHRGRIAVHRDLVRLQPGVELVEEVVEDERGTVVVVAVHLGRLILVEQHRHAVGARLLELPAGTPEPGEEPAQAAIRELAEETGYRAESVRRLGGGWVLPGLMRSWTEVFVAGRVRPGPVGPEPDEQIEVRLLPAGRVPELVAAGEIRDVNSIAALGMAGLLGRTPAAPAARRRRGM